MMTETVVNVQEAPNNNAAPNKQQTAGSSESPLSWIKVNVDYFRTLPGLLKIAELILGILCMALASPAIGGVHFFLFVATTSFIGTLIWVFIYMLGIREAINFPINWILTELLNTGICALFYILAFIVQLVVAIARGYGPYIAAGVFGLFNAATYSYASYLLNLEWQSSRTGN